MDRGDLLVRELGVRGQHRVQVAAHVPAALSCCLSLLSGSGLEGADAARQRLVAMTPGCVVITLALHMWVRTQRAGSAQAARRHRVIFRSCRERSRHSVQNFRGCAITYTPMTANCGPCICTNPQILSVSDNVNHWAHHLGRLSQGERHSISSRPEIVQISSNTRPAEIVLDIELEVSSIHFQFTTVTTTPTWS